MIAVPTPESLVCNPDRLPAKLNVGSRSPQMILDPGTTLFVHRGAAGSGMVAVIQTIAREIR